MKKLNFYFHIFIGFLLAVGLTAYAAPQQNFFKDLFPITTNTYSLGSSTLQFLNVFSQNASTTYLSIPATGYFNLNATGTMQGYAFCTSGNGLCVSSGGGGGFPAGTFNLNNLLGTTTFSGFLFAPSTSSLVGSSTLDVINGGTNNGSPYTGYNLIVSDAGGGKLLASSTIGTSLISGLNIVAITGGTITGVNATTTGLTVQGGSSLGSLVASNVTFTNATTSALSVTGGSQFGGATFSQNVGIGTTSPWASLSVTGTSLTPLVSIGTTTNPIFNIDQNGNVMIGTNVVSTQSTGVTSPARLTIGNIAGGKDLSVDLKNGISGGADYLDLIGNSNFVQLRMYGTNENWQMGSFGTTNFSFSDGSGSGSAPIFEIQEKSNTDQLFISSNGNIGLSSTSPSAILSINATTSVPALNITGATSSLLFLDSYGREGLASSSPYYLVSIGGNPSSGANGIPTSSIPLLGLNAWNDNGTRSVFAANNATSSLFYIRSDGSVSIGTNVPTVGAVFTVSGGSSLGNATTTGLTVQGGSSLGSLSALNISVSNATTTGLTVSGGSSLGSISALNVSFSNATTTGLTVNGGTLLGSLSFANGTSTGGFSVSGGTQVQSLSAGAATTTSLSVTGGAQFAGANFSNRVQIQNTLAGGYASQLAVELPGSGSAQRGITIFQPNLTAGLAMAPLGIGVALSNNNSLFGNFGYFASASTKNFYNMNFFGNNTNLGVTVTASGNIGVGTNTPNNILTVSGATTPALGFTTLNGNTAWTLGIDTADSNKFKIASSTAVGTLPIFTIDGTTSRIGINTTTPTSTLSVVGQVSFAGLPAESGASDDALCVGANGATALQVNRGATSCLLSTRRVKHDIKDLNVGLDEVMKLHPVSYAANSDNEQHVGLIAEEVYTVDPRLAVKVDGQINTVRYEEMNALLIKSIQELNIKVNNQQKEIDKLKKQRGK